MTISNFKIFNLILITVLTLSSDLLHSQNSTPILKDISGRITHLNKPLVNVNIIILDENTGTKTNAQGIYNIKAKPGDLIKYSHLGFKTVSIIVEDVTSILNIEMMEKVNTLKETVITTRKKTGRISEIAAKKNKKIKTAVGMVNIALLPTKVHYFDNKDIGPHYSDLREALRGKFSGKLPGIYDVDGAIYHRQPYIDLSMIKEVYVLTGLVGTMRWGGPVIIVRTYDSPEEIEKKLKEKEEKYRNQNYYADDAANIKSAAVLVSNSPQQAALKSIRGKITHLNAPLAHVNISLKGKNRGAKSNRDGSYNIKVRPGDIIKYSHIGFNTVSIIVEDVTSVLNIELTEKINELSETVVTARQKLGTISELAEKAAKKFSTAFGVIDPRASGFDIKYFEGKNITPGSPSVSAAMHGKFAGVKMVDARKLEVRGILARWDVDGQIFDQEPLIDLSNIKDIHILKQSSAATGGGPLIVVRTNYGSFEDIQEKKEAKAEKYRNQNYYTDDAVALKTDGSIYAPSKKSRSLKTISGTITHLDAPLANVNIHLKNQSKGSKSNAKGEYTLQASIGDIIQFRHLGYNTVSIIVEDITEILNIEMFTNTNALDAVVVTAKTQSSKILEDVEKKEKAFSTSKGDIDPKRVGYAIAFVDGEDILPIYASLTEALNGKSAGVRIDPGTNKLMVKPVASITLPLYPIWDVDGQIFDDEPPLDLNNIKSVHILRTLAGTARYGGAGAGGVIVVQSRFGSFDAIEAKRKKITEQYINKDLYSNDATAINTKALYSNSYTSALEDINNKQKAFAYYNRILKDQIEEYSIHISIAQKFISYYKDTNFTVQILKDLSLKHHKNTEILKAIAFQFQALGLKKETISTYESIFKLRPKYAQSYRDLANAYVENDQYKKAWRLYLSYLMQGNDISDEGIGQILYDELEFLYYNRRQQTEIKEKFIPKSDNLYDFRNDVRMVFEWNTSEAEFDLEFVNADKRVYVFDHSLAANEGLITDEKHKGYSSKAFKIDEIGIGEWLVNITYKGNKKPEPTYFKVSKYFHWGKPNQRQEVAVYKFESGREKIQLMRLNKDLLVAATY